MIDKWICNLLLWPYCFLFICFLILCSYLEDELAFFLILNQGLESMYSLAQKCMQFKPMSFPHKLMALLLGILGENTEVRNGVPKQLMLFFFFW